MMIPASALAHNHRTCLIFGLHRLTQLRCFPISWLDHRRLSAKKHTNKHEQPKPIHQIVDSYHDIFQYWTYLPGTKYHSMETIL